MTTASPADGPAGPTTGGTTSWWRAWVAVGSAAALVAVARGWGLLITDGGDEFKLRAIPWFGRWELGERTPMVVVAAAVGAAVVVAGPTVARRLPFPALAVAVAATSLAWTATLSLTEGPLSAIGEPLDGRFEYLAALPAVGDDPGGFVRTYTDELAGYPIHVQGHPPGMVLLLWSLDRIGFDGVTPAAIIVLLAGASASAAVLLAAREVLTEGIARRAAPFLAVLPAAVWVATTADALFTGVAAWAIACTVLASRPSRPARTAVPLALLGGVLFAAGLHLTYGLAPLAAIPAWVVVARRSWRTVPPVVVGGAAVVAAWLAAGFWLLDGLAATAERYEAGIASERPYGYFLAANLGVLAVSIGPAAVAGLATPRRIAGIGLPWAAVAALGAAHLSGLSKGEVERIWLPYVPWLVAAAGTTAVPAVVRIAGRRIDHDRLLLAAQVTLGLALAAFLRSPW